MPVMSEQDLVRNFHLVLPLLKKERVKVIGAGAGERRNA
jgi:hypothetical protein